MNRRELLGWSAALASGLVARAAGAAELVSPELVLTDLQLSGDAAFGRALLLVPRELPADPPLLLLLHGLGETHDQKVGARAYAERYGLLAAVSRLSRPPLERTLRGKEYFGAGRLEELNARLAGKPYRAPVIVCPYTPNPWKAGGAAVVERYASFLCGRLKSEVEERVGRSFPSTRVMVSGVSLGGYVALHIFLRRPEAFCGLGLAQAAFAQDQAARYAASLAEAASRVGPRRVEILSSSLDPYRRPSELLHRQLQRRAQASTLRVSPGPHDQSWLKESGVIEMLLSADDVFSERAQRGAK
jgi:pimeloyl-ACP methyl ester carboxylesterase